MTPDNIDDAEEFLKKNPDDPAALKIIRATGMFYLYAAIAIGSLPFFLKDFTDNIVPSLVLFIATGIFANAVTAEWRGELEVANMWVKRTFFALLAGFIMMSFMVSSDSYVFPQEDQTEQEKIGDIGRDEIIDRREQSYKDDNEANNPFNARTPDLFKVQ